MIVKNSRWKLKENWPVWHLRPAVAIECGRWWFTPIVIPSLPGYRRIMRLCTALWVAPPEAVKLETGVELFRNKHGELLGLTGNCAIYDRNTEQQVGIAAGTFLVMGVDEVLDETIDLNDDALEKYTDLLTDPNRSHCS